MNNIKRIIRFVFPIVLLLTLTSVDLCPLQHKALTEDIAKSADLKSYLDEFGESGVKAWKGISGLPKSFRTLDNVQAVHAFEIVSPGSLNSIENIANTIKSNRRQPFLNGLKNVANNNTLALTNKRQASADEVKNAVNNLRDFRKTNPSVPSDKNVATIEGTINGQSANQLSEYRKWISGDDTPLNQPFVWQAQNATSSSGATYFRSADSEYKMLNNMARNLEPNATVGQVYTSHLGEIQIISEIGYCTSCSGIIQDFNAMFPNIKIVLLDGIKG